MSKASLKEMLLDIKPGDYDKIMNYSITKEDIREFYNLYCEFTSLEDDYKEMTLGRRKVAIELARKLELLSQMGKLIARDMKTQKNHYENFMGDTNNINASEYYKVFEVLRQLASNDSVQYEIKTIKYPTYDSREHYGYRTTEEYTGEIMILGEKEALSKFDTPTVPYLTREMLTDIYLHGSSIALVGNDEYITERLNLANKQVLGQYHPIVFYLQDDDLAKATLSFMDFIEENGPDLSQMEVESIVQVIKSKYQSKHKVKKL